MDSKNKAKLLMRTIILLTAVLGMNSVAVYSQDTNPAYGENYSAKSPFKVEIGRLEASVYRGTENPLPLSQVPRLSEGDKLKIKLSNEAVNGVMPHESRWDWTLLVAFINPSRQFDPAESLSEEIRLRESGWYNDYFFTVPYDSQPMIFLYPKPKYKKKILEVLKKRPDAVREMGEKIIQISSGYGYLSSFLSQIQYMMLRPEEYGNGRFEQFVETMARGLELQLPACWRSYGYGSSSGGYGYGSYGGSYSSYNDLASRAQCLSRNIRLEDLNFSIGQMLLQGGLMLVSKLQNDHPEISKWIALAAAAVDLILKLTGKTAIRIIPTVVSTTDNPIYPRTNASNDGSYFKYGNTSVSQATGSSLGEAHKLTLFANYQPNDHEFLTVYAYVPNKWQPDPDPAVVHLNAPRLIEPCLHTGSNILRNTDLRTEWLSDQPFHDFKLVLSDRNGWVKELPLRKNPGLNGWETEISAGDLAVLPPDREGIVAAVSGRKGYSRIESPAFPVSISTAVRWKASVRLSPNGNSLVTLVKTAGDGRCSQNVIYTPVAGQSITFAIVRHNRNLEISPDGNVISFEVEGQIAGGLAERLKVQQVGGDLIPVEFTP